MPSQRLPETLDGKFLVLEDVQDPGNVGTMIRTADAAGFDGVFLSDKSADIYNMKVLRSMQGVTSICQFIGCQFPPFLQLLKAIRYKYWQRPSLVSRLTIRKLRHILVLPWSWETKVREFLI